MAQKKEPRRGDWYSEINNIKEEFNIISSEEEIKRIPPKVFKNIVKKGSEEAAIQYLKKLQVKGTKGVKIKYDSLDIQDYLKPCANITIEEQRYLFSLRSEMNPLKANFSQNRNITRTFCIEKCSVELNNEHLVWCQYLNKDSEYKYEDLLNGSLKDKI